MILKMNSPLDMPSNSQNYLKNGNPLFCTSEKYKKSYISKVVFMYVKKHFSGATYTRFQILKKVLLGNHS